jgi:hypothetical protein
MADDIPPSSDSDAGSNFSQARNEKLRKRALRRSRGKSVSDTSDEDEEAEQEMDDDVVPDSSPRRASGALDKTLPSTRHKGKQSTLDRKEDGGDEVDETGIDVAHMSRRGAALGSLHKKQLSSKQKGKQRAGDHTDTESDSGGGNNDGDDDRSHLRYATGPLSEEGQEEARKFGEATKMHADELARKYNKSPNTIMLAAGLTVQNARQRDNISNKFKVWYAHHHPKLEKGVLMMVHTSSMLICLCIQCPSGKTVAN